MDAQQLHQAATAAAQAAVDELIAKHGEASPHFGCCGFAWVLIKPARGKFVAFLKENNLGSRSFTGSGFEVRPEINYPAGSCAWQSIFLREAACRAYAKVLQSECLDCYVQSRVD